MNNKIRSNIYLDKSLKEEAKSFFKSYGLSLSDGINLLLKQLLKKEENVLHFSIELVDSKDDDYNIICTAEKNYEKNRKNYVAFDEINWD